MTDDTKQPESNQPTEGSGFEKIGQKGRLEYRMVTDGQKITDEIAAQVLEDFESFRKDSSQTDEPLSLSRSAELIGVSPSVLSDVCAGKYKGDRDAILTKIDQFLADDRARAGRFDFRTHAKLSFTDEVFGCIRSGIRMNTMPVIIASSGVGKSANARAFAIDRKGVAMIRIDEAGTTAHGVTRLICLAIGALRQFYTSPHPRRLIEIKLWLQRHLSTVIIVDECQKLDRSGLEMLRDIHDISDPNGRRNIPIVFFGDHNFKKLIFKGRAGERSPLSPQCIRRMRPVLDVDADCQLPDGGLYTVEDIVNIVRNNRVKLLTSRATRWIKDLANVIEYGALGNAMGVLQQAVDLVVGPGGELDKAIDVPDLQQALEMTFGKSVAIEINEKADGQLLRKVG